MEETWIFLWLTENPDEMDNIVLLLLLLLLMYQLELLVKFR